MDNADRFLVKFFQFNCGLDELMQGLQATLIPGGDKSPASYLKCNHKSVHVLNIHSKLSVFVRLFLMSNYHIMLYWNCKLTNIN